MLAPNRLITVKEQWLLLGVIAAILAGSVTMYLYGRTSQADEGVTTLAQTDPLASVALKRRHEPDRDLSLVPPVPRAPAAEAVAAESVSPGPIPTVPSAPVVHGSGAPALPPEAPSPYLSMSGELSDEPEGQTIGVAVMGAVNRPGLYMTPSTYRVADLIGLAGGATPDADLSEIMLTAALIDETTLTIPERAVQHVRGDVVSVRRRPSNISLNPAQYLKGAPRSEHEASRTPVQAGGISGAVNNVAPSGNVSNGAGLINVNQATAQQLEQLPGIGPVLASAIIAEREREPFSSVDDLLRVSGIGDKRLSAIRPLITAP